MGENGEQPNMAAILATIQALGGRVGRIEQPRREAVRNVHPAQRADDMPDLEDDPPLHEQNPRQHQPPDPQHHHNNPRFRDPVHRGRMREEEPARHSSNDIKLSAPTFAGRVNPEAYLEWERRMEYIFEYYGYNDQRKIALAAAQLTDHALSWWDRDVSERRRHRYEQITTWTAMKFNLRKRYVPPHFHRDLQKRFRKLVQGNRSVEDYFEEFEQLRNRLELEDDGEALMAQFVDGLQERIADKVEIQPYHDMSKVLHLAMQAEQHLKRKLPTNRNRNNNWIPQAPKPMDRGKAVEIDSRFKKPFPDVAKATRPEQGKPQFNQRTRDITCFKCQGRGHMARECPNNRVMIMMADGGYESQDDMELDPKDTETEDVEYPDAG